MKSGRKTLQRVNSWTYTNQLGRFIRVATEAFNDKYVIGFSQQVAYNILFSFAPLLIFLTGCLTLVAQWTNRNLENPAQPIIDWIHQNLPADIASVIEAPINDALASDASVLLSISGILALWTAKNATASIMRGLNATYGIPHLRPYLQHNGVAIGLTIWVVLAGIAISFLQVIGTQRGAVVAQALGFADAWANFVSDLQLPITLVVLVLVLVTLHRFGPTYRGPFWWYLPGAIFTVLGVGVAMFGFRLYFVIVSDVTAYSAFGAVLVFLLLLYILSLVILLGGVINSALFQTYPPAQRALERFRSRHPGTTLTFEPLPQSPLPQTDATSL